MKRILGYMGYLIISFFMWAGWIIIIPGFILGGFNAYRGYIQTESFGQALSLTLLDVKRNLLTPDAIGPVIAGFVIYIIALFILSKIRKTRFADYMDYDDVFNSRKDRQEAKKDEEIMKKNVATLFDKNISRPCDFPCGYYEKR